MYIYIILYILYIIYQSFLVALIQLLSLLSGAGCVFRSFLSESESDSFVSWTIFCFADIFSRPYQPKM